MQWLLAVKLHAVITVINVQVLSSTVKQVCGLGRVSVPPVSAHQLKYSSDDKT